MIKEKYVNIKMCNSNIKQYKSKNIDCKNGDIVEVDINLVAKSSHVKITAICDHCKNEELIPFKKYNKCINSSTLKLYHCNKCTYIKIQLTNLERYGSKSAINNQLIKNKIKETNIKKYGVEHPMKSKEFKEKMSKDYFKKHGVSYTFQNKDVKNKIKNTLNNKYGVDYPMQSNEILKKSNDTILNKYNVSNISQLDDIKNKKIETSLKNYGVYHPSQSIDIQNKRKNSCLQKYGANHEMQSLEYYNHWLKTCKRTKTFKNTNLYYQSLNELNFLNLYYDKILIENGKRFEYLDKNNNKHYYFSDFYIPSYNLIVEIKSKYTFDKNKEINLLKQQCVLLDKYNFIFIIDLDYNEFNKLIQLNE